MNYKIIHTTTYTYAGSVSLCHNIAMLTPRNTQSQVCKSSVIHITPEPDVINEYFDFFGNKVTYFAIQEEHQKLTVTVQSQIAQLLPAAPRSDLYIHCPWNELRTSLMEPNAENFEARQFLSPTQMTLCDAAVKEYALHSFSPGRSVYEAIYDLNQRIYKDFEYKPGFTTITTPVQEVMASRKGVCQDFAHLAIACLRCMGLPARYVSGYIETIPLPGKEKLVGSDASHAWFSAFIPNVGWIDFDPTNNQLSSHQHVTIGWGRDYSDITPLKGVILSSGAHQLEVSVDMRPA